MSGAHNEAVAAAVGHALARGDGLGVLFVCSGNICRSPLGHAQFADLVRRRGVEEFLRADSVGLHGYHAGDNADPRMRACAARHGLALDHAARKVQAGDFAAYDLILAMDRGHLADLRRLAPEAGGRVALYRAVDPQGVGDVPDPYYGERSDFEQVWDIVERCGPRWLEAVLAALAAAGRGWTAG